MKRFLCIFLCAILTLMPLCSCGDDGDAVSESDAVSEVKWIDRQFAEAERMYAWFAGCGKPACSAADAAEIDGTVYHRVAETGLSDMAALRARLEEKFAVEIVDALMETVVYSGVPMFRDIDGRLYCCSESYGQVPYDLGERIGTIDSQVGTEMVYRVDITYDYYASSFAASCDYQLLLGEDGKWRFQNFELPALLIAGQMFTDVQETQ